MKRWKVVEKEDHNAVHCFCNSELSATNWIEQYGDSNIFMDKTLTKQSFEVIELGEES